jgi:hypothetical protein
MSRVSPCGWEQGRLPKKRLSFRELQEDVGFDDYHREEARYKE